MRKLVFLMVISLVVVFAVPAGAKVVINESHYQYEIQADLNTDHSNGGAFAFEGDQGSGFQIEYNAHYRESHECEFNAQMLGMSIQGSGELDFFLVDPLKAKNKFTTGEALGTFLEGSMQVWYCNWELDFDGPLEGVEFTMFMDGTDGSLAKVSGGDSFHIPGDVNSSDKYRGEQRAATGSIYIPFHWNSDVDFPEGVPGSIGYVKWSSHYNEK